jgi:hypothetical protein
MQFFDEAGILVQLIGQATVWPRIRVHLVISEREKSESPKILFLLARESPYLILPGGIPAFGTSTFHRSAEHITAEQIGCQVHAHDQPICVIEHGEYTHVPRQFYHSAVMMYGADLKGKPWKPREGDGLPEQVWIGVHHIEQMKNEVHPMFRELGAILG